MNCGKIKVGVGLGVYMCVLACMRVYLCLYLSVSAMLFILCCVRVKWISCIMNDGDDNGTTRLRLELHFSYNAEIRRDLEILDPISQVN